MRSEATVLEQQPVPDEAVKAAQAIMLDGVERDVERVRRKIDTRAAVEAAAPFIRAPLEAENARLREALTRIAYGLEGEMGRYDTPRDNTWWGRIALEALGGDRA
jgi:hypothetical protein